MRQIVVRHLIVGALLMVVTLVGIVLSGLSPHVAYIAALAFLLSVATAGVRRLGETVASSRWPSPVPVAPDAPGVDPRIGGLETLLHRSTVDANVFRRRLRVLLADLATHRLERDHGINPTEHPEEARQLLGDDAWRVLTEASAARAADIERTIAAIERLPRLERAP